MYKLYFLLSVICVLVGVFGFYEQKYEWFLVGVPGVGNEWNWSQVLSGIHHENLVLLCIAIGITSLVVAIYERLGLE